MVIKIEKNNLKIIKNDPLRESIELKKLVQWVTFINEAQWLLLGIDFLILIYFYIKTDVIFEAIGWLPFPKEIHWFLIFMVILLVRALIAVFVTFTIEYIKDLSLWTEKEKKNALYVPLYVLAGITLLLLPISLPLLWSYLAYMAGNEILFDHWVLGTFRRLLTEQEINTLYQETVQNFFEKIEASKEVKEQLTNFVQRSEQVFLKKYENGSVFGTEFFLREVEITKNYYNTIRHFKDNVAVCDLQVGWVNLLLLFQVYNWMLTSFCIVFHPNPLSWWSLGVGTIIFSSVTDVVQILYDEKSLRLNQELGIFNESYRLHNKTWDESLASLNNTVDINQAAITAQEMFDIILCTL